MTGKLRTGVITLSLVVVLYVLIGGVLGQTSGAGAYKQLAVLSEVLNRIRSEYVEAPDMGRVTAGALHGLLESLDPYSAYLTPREFEEYQARKNKSEAGVGLVLSKRGYIVVIATLPESPAERAGLRTGYVLESIAGFTTREMSVEQAYLLLEGETGTSVSVAIITPFRSAAVQMELVRARPRTPNLISTKLGDAIGYLKVASFPTGRSEELRRELTLLQSGGANQLVLDLRGCAAGEMTEGIETARLFLESGLITYTKGQQSPRENFSAESAKVAWNGSVAVLIDRGTAGAAEVVASALLEHKRAQVLGTRSFGKGSLQRLIPLDDGAALLLSIAKYYTPAGRAIQDSGVTPNIPVARGNAFEETPALRHAPPAPGDAVVLKALEALRTEVEKTAKKAA
jgi:carboxyl-terminal processing protease